MTQKPKPKRWLCQFRDVGKGYFKTDCGFDTLRSAENYVDVVIVTLTNVAEGQVVDNEKKEIVYHYKKG